MRTPTTLIVILLLSASAYAQKRRPTIPPPKSDPPISIQTATTKDGRTVLLRSDGTWEYTNDPVVAPVAKNDAAEEALKALRVMAGATEVGINFPEYGRRLIDLKADVEKALKSLPEGELKAAVGLSLKAYADAGQAWNEFIKRPSRSRYSEPSIFLSDPWVAELQKTYDIPIKTLERGGGAEPFRYMDRTPVLSTIWAAGRKHLEKAESLLPK